MNLPDNPYVICSSADNVCRKLGFFPLDREYKEIINVLKKYHLLAFYYGCYNICLFPIFEASSKIPFSKN